MASSQPQGQKVGVLRQVLPWGSWLLPRMAGLCQGGQILLGLVSESWPGSRLGPPRLSLASFSPNTHRVRPPLHPLL